MKLISKIEFSGSIHLLTGLHIGGSNTSMSIGGIDKSVIRNPLTNQPYIPGSSLKGKLRSLYEIAHGLIGEKPIGNVKNSPSNKGPAADLFGNATNNDSQKPSRVIVRDCMLINHEELLQKTEIPYTEVKTEVVIDRITSAANPRQLERIPAGAKFSMNIILNIWEGENPETMINRLFEAMQLLHDDYLGGSGSRGYGRIAIHIDSLLEKTVEGYYQNANGKANDIKEKYQILIDRLKES